MKHSLLYFIAAALFLIATSLDLFTEGPNLKTVAGAIMFGVMLTMGLRLRREGN